MNKLIAATAALFSLPQLALAHPGHDHSHWLSNPIHWLTVAAIGSVVVVAIILKKKADKSNKTD
ncbi:hypothetical protein SIN8267_00827 [Sinobacterium norvegicum]|uniref:Uncharacterized protein n=1 Tax=Sinobacterium norvegicum TaxID=1641715 RepID=A0ABM9ABZ7_9GAMM|nr:hypothetical protein [Sinobacterium norvegicum]CAH0990732.1 hypothetical protein SIN8267_00827 [Sinobacterium norvegicum]